MNRSAKTSGYTLLEMMVVLAILAALAALTLPAMRGPLDKSRLRGASRQVQAALSKARFFSIRKGTRVEFRYQLNGSDWVIQTVSSQNTASENEFAGGNENSTPSGLSIESPANNSEFLEDGLETSEGEWGQEQSVLLRQGELPATISFIEFLEEDETESFENFVEFLAETPASDSNEIELNESGEQIIWSEPILFLPNGRTEDATIRLSGPRDFYVDLKIRGLTGAISYTAPFRIRQEEDSLSETDIKIETEEGIE